MTNQLTVIFFLAALTSSCVNERPTLEQVLSDFEIEAGVVFEDCGHGAVECSHMNGQGASNPEGAAMCLVDASTTITCGPTRASLSWYYEGDPESDLHRSIYLLPRTSGDGCRAVLFAQTKPGSVSRIECDALNTTSDCELLDFVGCETISTIRLHVPVD